MSGLVLIDCTAGSGRTDKGEPGSPIIFNRYLADSFSAEFGGRYRQLCCEEDRKNFESLSKIDLANCDVQRGSYIDLLQPWLNSLPYSQLYGVIYVDPNGIVDALEGMDLFRRLQRSQRTDRIDLLFNVSLNAYKRHQAVKDSLYNGLPPQWVTVPLIEHLDQLAGLKQCNYIRKELGGLPEWIMLYGLNSKMVRLTRRTAQIVPYQEWRENAEHYLNGGIKVAPGQMRMELL